MKVGFVTIGQSPRTDILSDIAPLLTGIDVVERGALDDVDRSELPRLAPDGQVDDFPLASRLRDGTPVTLSKRKIYPLMQAAINAVVEQGVGAVVILCTGEFAHLHAPVLTIFPDRLLTHFVQAVLPAGACLGVLAPLAAQVPVVTRRWSSICAETQVISLSPYAGFEEGIDAVSELIGSTLIVMDCLGYNQGHKAAVQRRTGAPVVLPRTVIARTIQELLLGR